MKTAFREVNKMLITTTYSLAVLELMKHEQNTCIQKVVIKAVIAHGPHERFWKYL